MITHLTYDLYSALPESHLAMPACMYVTRNVFDVQDGHQPEIHIAANLA